MSPHDQVLALWATLLVGVVLVLLFLVALWNDEEEDDDEPVP